MTRYNLFYQWMLNYTGCTLTFYPKPHPPRTGKERRNIMTFKEFYLIALPLFFLVLYAQSFSTKRKLRRRIEKQTGEIEALHLKIAKLKSPLFKKGLITHLGNISGDPQKCFSITGLSVSFAQVGMDLSNPKKMKIGGHDWKKIRKYSARQKQDPMYMSKIINGWIQHNLLRDAIIPKIKANKVLTENNFQSIRVR